MTSLDSLFKTAVERGASDIHLVPGYYPTLRINGELYPLKVTELLSTDASADMIQSVLAKEQKEYLLMNKEIDVGINYEHNRFRCNFFFTKGSIGGVFRLIPGTIKTIDELNLPTVLHEFAKYQSGLVLLTGPTGEGKSTTLASMINEINTSEARRIVTIEDPIEYVYPSGKSMISQRELHLDTHSWTVALRSALREDPDVVLVGEMRDYDTIQAVLTMAETGHLVFSTLHTSTTSEAINRIIDVFPAHQQSQVRSQLASVLRAVVSQRLVPNIDHTNRVPALEILLNIPAVASLIRDGKPFLLDNVIETEEKHNMILFEKYLAKLYRAGTISKQTALDRALRPEEVKKFVQ